MQSLWYWSLYAPKSLSDTVNKRRVFSQSWGLNVCWIIVGFCAVVHGGCCCLQESAVKCLDCGTFLWNVNSSSTHSSSWVLSFPFQWEHAPHTFHPLSRPQHFANRRVASLILVLTCRCWSVYHHDRSVCLRPLQLCGAGGCSSESLEGLGELLFQQSGTSILRAACLLWGERESGQ